MKKITIAVLLVIFVFNISCGSTTTSSDSTPREVKVIALTGTLMAFVANASARDVVYDDLVVATESGTITTSIEKAYSELSLEGASDDTFSVDSGSWVRTTTDGVTTVTLTDISYSSQMVEYPWNDTTPFAGAVIDFDNIDHTVSASTDATGMSGSFTITLKGTGSLTDLTPTENTVTSNDIEIGTMTVNILEPSQKTGTVTFKDAVFGGAIEGDQLTSSTILTATVGYASRIYTCTILAIYTPTIPGNTGIGELEVTSATCTNN